jgi:hypothetical protein
MTIKKPQKYRDFIDHMVEVCRHGQGSIGPARARSGIWNRNATPDELVDQYAINQLLADLNDDQRGIIAGMLADAFQGGVFETLKALEEFEVEPFVEGYEGSPYHDFVGRVVLDQWEWPLDK